MKIILGMLLCLCLGCGGNTLQGTWANGLGLRQAVVDFRSDGSVIVHGQKSEIMTWKGSVLMFDRKRLKVLSSKASELDRFEMARQPFAAQVLIFAKQANVSGGEGSANVTVVWVDESHFDLGDGHYSRSN